MGTTRIKVIDLSSDKGQIKTSRKHAEKLVSSAKIKTKKATVAGKLPEEEKPKSLEDISRQEKPASTEITERLTEETKSQQAQIKEDSAPSVGARKKHPLRHRGKKYQEAKKLIENKPYSVKDAIQLLPKTSITRFDPSVEIHLLTLEKSLKDSVRFPYSFAIKQKQTRYLVFSDKRSTSSDKHVIWGDEKTITDIETGKLKPGRDFDTVISSPKFMPTLAKIAKILGPKGMMPNPKNQTVTEDFEKVIGGSDKSNYQYKSDPTSPVIHAKIGKLSQKPNELEENLKALILTIGMSKIKNGVLTSTMSPAIKVDLSTIS